MDNVNGLFNLKNSISVDALSEKNPIKITKTTINNIPMTAMGTPSKAVTDNIIEQALEQSTGRKSVNLLLNNSPVGLGEHPSSEDIQNAGYTLVSSAYHMGAPAIYKSADGSTISVYSGKGSAEMGEDKRKIVYQTGRYTQEMFYDENGRLTSGRIIIKDNIAGFTEQQYDFTIGQDNNIESVIR